MKNKNLENLDKIVPYSEGDLINLYDLFMVIWKGKYIILSICASTVIITAIISLVMTQIYSSATSVVPITLNPTSGLSEALTKGYLPLSASEDETNRIMAVLRSRTIRHNIIKKLDLEKKFVPRSPKNRNPLYLASEALFRITTISDDPKTGIITIEVMHQNPELCTKIANAYVDELNKILNYSFLKIINNKLGFLEEQMIEAEIKMRKLKQEMVKFQRKTKIIEPNEQTKWTMNLYTELITKRTEVQVKLNELETALSPASPEVKALQRQLSTINGKIAQIEKRNNVGSLPSLKNAPDKLSSYAELNRKLKLSETIYETLLKLYEQTKFEVANENLYVQVIDPAVTPDVKTIPRRKPMVIKAAIGSFIFSIILLFLIDISKKFKEIHEEKKDM